MLNANPKPKANSMKSIFIGAISLVAASSSAQYSIDWWTVDGGGGTSTGGVYTLNATIGQHDAGSMSGGQFALVGGFWAIVAVQTTGIPTLTIIPAGLGQATLSWTPDTPGFHLQTSDSLSVPAWTNAPSGTNHPIMISTTEPGKFYRLVNP